MQSILARYQVDDMQKRDEESARLKRHIQELQLELKIRKEVQASAIVSFYVFSLPSNLQKFLKRSRNNL